jgi:GxxExxY protein
MISMGLAPLPPEIEQTAKECVDCGMTVHRVLGPGFKEPIYHRAFCLELDSRGIKYQSEKRISVPYKSWMIPGHRLDLVVGELVLIEFKAVPRLRKVHSSQVFSYLKATNLRLGLLMNFGGRLFKDGLKRVIR